MSRVRQNSVEILNPIPGGARYTTRKSARKFVRRGLAVFEDGDAAVRFLDDQRRTEPADSSGGAGGEFWWRLGKTGGMVQQIGSAVRPRVRKRREEDKTI
jgi:hypothetical protein